MHLTQFIEDQLEGGSAALVEGFGLSGLDGGEVLGFVQQGLKAGDGGGEGRQGK